MRASISMAIAALATSVSAIDTISIKGSKFFTSSGSQFFIKGTFVDGRSCHMIILLTSHCRNRLPTYSRRPSG